MAAGLKKWQRFTGYSRNWIYELVWGYNRIGPDTLGDGRHHNPGAKPLLDDVQQANLLQALRGPAPDGGLWNGRKVADYLTSLIGQPISRQQGWEYLKQMRQRLRVPQQSHQEANPEEQEAWKKKLATVVEQVHKEHAIAAVEVNNVSLKMRAALFRVVCWWLELSVSKAALIFNDFSLVWCEDEHRIGLQPVMRRLWVEEGEQPVAVVNWKREWLWLYAFVQPQTGETYWWILPYVNTKLFSRVLKDFAQHFGAGKDKRIILPLDQAGWHTRQRSWKCQRASTSCLYPPILLNCNQLSACGH